MHLSYINHPGSVALLEVEEHSWFMEMCQQGHVLYLVKLWWIHWANVIYVHCDNLKNEFRNLVKYMTSNNQMGRIWAHGTHMPSIQRVWLSACAVNATNYTHLSNRSLHRDLGAVLVYDFCLDVLLLRVRYKEGCLGIERHILGCNPLSLWFAKVWGCCAKYFHLGITHFSELPSKDKEMCSKTTRNETDVGEIRWLSCSIILTWVL